MLSGSLDDRTDWLALVRIASDVSPRDPEVLFRHGRLLFSLGQRDGAVDLLQSCVRLSPAYGLRVAAALIESGESYAFVARTFEDNAEALVGLSQPMFQRGLEIEPHNPKLREALSSLQ